MTNRLAFLVLLAAMSLGAVPAVGQSEAADVTASVEVLPASVTVTPVVGFDFGQVYANEGVLASSQRSAPAQWQVEASQGPRQFELTFALPTELVAMIDRTEFRIPIWFETDAGAVVDNSSLDGNTAIFDPNVPFNFAVGASVPIMLEVELGGGISPAGNSDAVVDVSGAAPGVYSGTITLTVTLL